MRVVACVALCAACTTAPPGDGGAAVFQAVQSPTGATGTIAVSMSPTKANDLLYISLVYAGPSYPPARVSTAAGFADPLDWTTMAGCAATTYDWIVKSADPGATAVTVDLPSSVAGQLFVLELSGVSQEAEAASVAPTGAGSTALAAQVDGAPGQVVISTISTCGTVAAIAPGSPFVTFANTARGDVAYYVPPATGSYGAAWMLDRRRRLADAHRFVPVTRGLLASGARTDAATASGLRSMSRSTRRWRGARARCGAA